MKMKTISLKHFSRQKKSNQLKYLKPDKEHTVTQFKCLSPKYMHQNFHVAFEMLNPTVISLWQTAIISWTIKTMIPIKNH